jgi:hypothetical protein
LEVAPFFRKTPHEIPRCVSGHPRAKGSSGGARTTAPHRYSPIVIVCDAIPADAATVATLPQAHPL